MVAIVFVQLVVAEFRIAVADWSKVAKPILGIPLVNPSRNQLSFAKTYFKPVRETGASFDQTAEVEPEFA